MAEAREAGVSIPILPGLMPITSAGRLARVLELTGERRPVALAAGLASAADASAQHEVGVAHAAELTRAVLDGGAPGVHLYAFNNHDTVLTVLQRAGVVPVAARS